MRNRVLLSSFAALGESLHELGRLHRRAEGPSLCQAFATYKDSFCAAAANDGNGNAPRIHTYRSDDAHGDIDASGYFNAIADKLRIGDLIYHCEVTNYGLSNEAVQDAQFFVVVTITAGVVHVSAETAIVVTTS